MRKCTSSWQAVHLLESLYPHLSTRESTMRLVAALMVFLRSNDSAQALRALKRIAVQEGTTLYELVLGDRKEYFEVTDHRKINCQHQYYFWEAPHDASIPVLKCIHQSVAMLDSTAYLCLHIFKNAYPLSRNAMELKGAKYLLGRAKN